MNFYYSKQQETAKASTATSATAASTTPAPQPPPTPMLAIASTPGVSTDSKPPSFDTKPPDTPKDDLKPALSLSTDKDKDVVDPKVGCYIKRNSVEK